MFESSLGSVGSFLCLGLGFFWGVLLLGFLVLSSFVYLCVCVCDSKAMEETPEVDTNLEVAESGTKSSYSSTGRSGGNPLQ